MKLIAKVVMGVLFALTACLTHNTSEAAQWSQRNIFITFWSPPPPTTSALSTVAREGFNLTWTESLIFSKDYGLDAAHGQGLKAIVQDPLLSPAVLDNPEKRRYLDALIKRVKAHPAFEAYYLSDEPNAAQFAGLGRLVAYLKERDPEHFAYINLYPIYATNRQLGVNGSPVDAYKEYLRRFIAEVKPELISYDHYHFFKTGDGQQYFLNLELIRQAALDNGLPFLNIIQASTIEKHWRLVNGNELRWLVYTTLAYGARGISYFLYWGPVSYGGLYQNGVRTPLVDVVSVLNKEIAALGGQLMELESQGIYHTGPLPAGTQPIPPTAPVQFGGKGEYVLGFFGKGGFVTSFMVVNRNYRSPSSALLDITADIRGVEELNRKTGQWEEYMMFANGHRFSVDLAPGDGRLFRLVR